MDVIASQLGVSSQALLKRFQSKQELVLAAILPNEPAPWAEIVENGPDDRPLKEQLAEIMAELAEFFVDVSRRMSVLRWSGVEPAQVMDRFDVPPPIADIRLLSDWLSRASRKHLIRKVDNEATAMLMLTSMHGPAMLTEMLGKHPTGHSRKQYVDYMVDMLMQGLVARTDNDQLEPQS